MAFQFTPPAAQPAEVSPDPQIGVIQSVPIKLIRVKPQFRKHFDEVRLAELTDSVRRYGVLQPVLVRPLGGVPVTGYQLVAGERRYRAANAAGLTEIPAHVRPMTDLEVLEIQVIENLQRQDLHPLEEADGFRALLEAANRDLSPTEPRLTVDGLAARIHRSRDYVYKRLRLADLAESVKEAFWEGKISLQIALLISRLSNPEIQSKAVAYLIDNQYEKDEPISYRFAVNTLRTRFLLYLEHAPFDTEAADLYPEAGPCTSCPKRTVNSPDLFGDITSSDMCTDEMCYRRKLDAHWERAAEAARQRGQQILSDQEARRVLSSCYGLPEDGYVKTTHLIRVDDDDWKQASELIEQLPESDRPNVTLARNPHDGLPVELVNRAEVEQALIDAGIIREVSSPSEFTSSSAQHAEARRRKEFDDVAMDRIVDRAVSQAIPPVNPLEFWRTLARLVVIGCDAHTLRRVCKRRGWEILKSDGYQDLRGTVSSQVEHLTADRLCGLIVETLVFAQQINCEPPYVSEPISEAMQMTAKLYGVDLEALRKELDRAADDSKGAKKAKVAAHACPVCGTEFETWQQAQECKEECLAAQGSASPADTAEPAEPAPAPPAAPTPIVRRKRFPYACSRCGDVFITQDDAEKCELRCAAMPESNELTFTFEPSEGVTLAKAVVRAVHDPRDNWKVDVNLLVSECQGFKAPTSGRFRSFSNPRSAVVTGLEWIREYVIKERARPHGLSINEALKQVEDFAREWIDRLTGFLPDPPVPPPPAPPKKQRRKKKELAHV